MVSGCFPHITVVRFEVWRVRGYRNAFLETEYSYDPTIFCISVVLCLFVNNEVVSRQYTDLLVRSR